MLFLCAIARKDSIQGRLGKKVFQNFVKDYSGNIRNIRTETDCENIDPKKIELELREVRADSLESKLFLWWNLIWWSLPYEEPIGRQMRFLLWDKTH